MKNSVFFSLKKNSKNGKNEKIVPNEERICLSMISDEFRKLAENSREQSKAMKAALSNIRESASRIKNSSEEIIERYNASVSAANR
ncbi:MAG: hypothetical protein FWD14_07760 [Treponema sp.]|nr:hypothetical protein [Treponema sp.]